MKKILLAISILISLNISAQVYSGKTINGNPFDATGNIVISTGGSGGSADSLKTLPIDTSANTTGYVLAFDAGLHKWYLKKDSVGGSGAVTGSGTINYIPKFTASSTLGNSLLQDNGSGLAYNTTLISQSAFHIANTATGTGTSLLNMNDVIFAVNSINSTGNLSSFVTYSANAGSGNAIGTYSFAYQGTGTGEKYGLLGQVGNISGSTKAVGVFAYYGGAYTSNPPAVTESAALIADNSSFAVPAFIARNNAVDVFAINSSGKAVYYHNPTMSAATGADSLTVPDWKAVDSLLRALSILTASNGLTKTGNDVALGGSLTGNTNISSGANTLKQSGSANVAGIFQVQNTSTTGGAIEAYTNGGVAGQFEVLSSDSNTVLPVLNIFRQTSGTAENGIGTSIQFQTKTTTSTSTSNTLISKWTNATEATKTSEFSISGVNSATTNTLLTLSGSGATKLNQYGVGNFQSAPAYDLAVTSTGDIVERRDTIPLLSFGFGSALAGDTAASSTSAIYGSIHNSGTDTLNISKMRIGLQGTSPNVTVTIYWNDSLGVTGAGAVTLVNAGSAATDIYTGTTVTTFDNAKIPPGVWVWCQTTTVTTKPTYLSVTLIGSKIHN